MQVRTIYLALFLCAAPFCHARDLAIVVNKSNSASKVNGTDLEKLLKVGQQAWPDGKKVKIFLTDPASPEMKTILPRAYKMSAAEIKTFADAHRPDIQIVASDDLVLTMVQANPGAIGIVNVYSINSGVKVLKVDEKLPMEPGYMLHGN